MFPPRLISVKYAKYLDCINHRFTNIDPILSTPVLLRIHTLAKVSTRNSKKSRREDGRHDGSKAESKTLLCPGMDDSLYSRGPQAELRVYGQVNFFLGRRESTENILKPQ
jgi:hypothetical protein